MKEWFIKLLLAALEDERVREALADLLQEAQPKPAARPKRGTAPGAIS